MAGEVAERKSHRSRTAVTLRAACFIANKSSNLKFPPGRGRTPMPFTERLRMVAESLRLGGLLFHIQRRRRGERRELGRE